MARTPDPRVEQAHDLFKQGKKLIEIAQQLEVSEGTVRSWKSRGKWGDATLQKGGRCVAKRKRGGQPGNHNAKGGPVGNKKAEKFGFFSEWLPGEVLKIFDAIEERSPLDMLWDQIKFAYTAIIRAQQIAFVKDKNDKTIEKVAEKDGNVCGESWEVQEAWDKHTNFMKAQARAQGELRNLIKQYDEMLHNNWENATEEQKLRIAKLKADIDSKGDRDKPIQITFMKASEKHGND